MISNLLQELALASEHNRRYIVLHENRLHENPIDRLTYDEKVRRLQEAAQQKFIVDQKAVIARRAARKGSRKTR